MWARMLLLVLTASAALGCSSGDESVVACDPLAADAGEVALASILGAGESADGTTYVIDRKDRELRAFISEQGELYRQRVSGTGEGNTDGSFVLVSLDEREPQLSLLINTDVDGNVRMGVAAGPLATKTFVIGEEGEELTLLADDDVMALPIHNYPAEVVIEYSAELADGRRLLVLRPRDLRDYEEFRVFLGAADRLEERPLTSATRQRDGGTTELKFEVEGEPARAFFPIESTADGFTPGDPSLTIAGKAVGLTLTTTTQSPTGASYYCLE